MVRNVRQIVRCGIQIYPTVHSLSGRRVKDRSRPFVKGRNPPGNGEENLPSPDGLRSSLTSARVCPSDCCGKIPWSGSIRNSKNARSTCNKTSCLLLLPGQGSLGSEVHPNEFASRHAKTIAPWTPDAQSPLGRSFGGLSFSGMPSRKLLRRSPGQSSRQRAPPHGARAHRRGRTRRPRPPCPSKTS